MSSLIELAPQRQSESAVAKQKAATVRWQQAIPAVAICLVLIRVRVRLLMQPLPVFDFMTYWAAGRLFLSRSNPYSASAMYAIERSLGWSYSQPLVLLNPPWALPFAALLGILPFHIAHYVWLIVSLAIEAICAVALWRYFGGESRKQWMALVLILTFLPAGSAEQMGQITPLMLAGLTGFLILLRRRRDLLAGACLIALGPKPHLLYLVIFAIVLWTAQTRRWTVAIGATLAYTIATIGAIGFNHSALRYFQGTTQAALNTSCGVGGVLRSLFGVQHTWLQFVPTAVGIVWFAFYWTKHRRTWRWDENLPMLLLVSIATAPYSWAHDYILAVPSLVALEVAILKTRTDWLIPSAFYLVVQIVIFTEAEMLSKAWMATASLLWLALYWAGSFCLESRKPAPIELRD